MNFKLKNIVAVCFLIIFTALFIYVSFNFNSSSSYPNKPITIIVHSKPGSGVDLMARKVSTIARKYSKVPFVIENRTGTQGLVAMQYVQNQKADGYTMLAVAKSFLSTILVNKSRVSISDFHFLANMVSDPETLITNNKSNVITFKDILEDANKSSEAQRWIGPGVGGRDHLMAMKTWKELKIKGRWIDYKSGPQSVLSILRKEAPVYVGNPLDVKGKPDLTIAVVAAPKRLEAFPDAPTFKELGYNLNEYMWRGFSFKKGVPESAVAYVEDVLRKVSLDEEWISYCNSIFSFPDFKTNKEFTSMVQGEMAETKALLKKAGLLKQYIIKGAIPQSVVLIILSVVVVIIVLLLTKFNFRAWNRDTYLSAGFIIFSIFFIYNSTLFQYDKATKVTSPALIPTLWSSFMLILGMIYLVKSTLMADLDKLAKRERSTKGVVALASIILVFIVYILAVTYIGYFLSTIIFLITLLRVLKYRDISGSIIYSTSFIFISYLVFELLLKINLPVGKIFL